MSTLRVPIVVVDVDCACGLTWQSPPELTAPENFCPQCGAAPTEERCGLAHTIEVDVRVDIQLRG